MARKVAARGRREAPKSLIERFRAAEGGLAARETSDPDVEMLESRRGRVRPSPPVEMPEIEDDPEVAAASIDVGMLEDAEWMGELPPPEPSDVAVATNHNLSAVDITDADLDNLWDWVRQDADKGLKFLGTAPTSSAHMRAMVGRFVTSYALHEDNESGVQHIGFGAFGPVNDQMAVIHLYLAPSVRGRLRELAPGFLEMAVQAQPGKKLMVFSKDPADVRLYRPLGFSPSFVMEWVPPAPTRLE